MHSETTLQPFDYNSADEAPFRLLWAHNNRLRAERLPDDPPLPFENFLAELRAMPQTRERHGAMIHTADGAIVGRAVLFFDTSGDNPHTAFTVLDVLPEQRGRGLGRRLLAFAAETATSHGRRLLMFETSSRVPAGGVFAERMGARRGMEAHLNQLDLAELERGLVAEWIARAAERASGFELRFWDGPFPEAELPAVAALLEVMNSAPSEELELNEEHWTPERVRQRDASYFVGGRQRLVAYVRESATGTLAGYSELYLAPYAPQLLNQGDTAVRPEYRNRGLGRWLKAGMLERVLRELPAARFVRTGNADSNAPMLAINYALGFKPYLDTIIWQVEAAQAQAWAQG